LIDWNVEVVSGLPGDGLNGIMEALRKSRTAFPLSRWAAAALKHKQTGWPGTAGKEFRCHEPLRGPQP
jgi:thiamine pyrophosphate-dependent acetolactate synthase large subunit-like protein